MKNFYNEYFIVFKFELFNLKIIIKVKSKDGFDGLKYFLFFGNNIDDFFDLNEVNFEIDLVLGILLLIDNYLCYVDYDRDVFCEWYGVIKWFKEGDLNILLEDGDLIWWNLFCGYEKCIFDIV